MALSAIEVRVLGALIEKERTTPEGYPLSSQALLTACNQKTSRDPVTAYHLQEVQAAVQRLRDRGLAATVHGATERVPKHLHRAAEALELNRAEAALLAVLMLRGEQTPGELRTRTDRYQQFKDLAEVEAALARLQDRSTPLVKNLGRAAGQSQDRWIHALGQDEERLLPRARAVRAEVLANRPAVGAPTGADAATPSFTTFDAAGTSGEGLRSMLERLEALEGRVAAVEAAIARQTLEI